MKKKIALGIGVVVVAGLVYYLWFSKSGPTYDLVAAAKGTIVQDVSVTGNTAPVHSLDLAFENGGTVSAVGYDVGSHVNAGAVLASLNTSDLQAQLAQAQANVDAETAQLHSLQAGPQPADIQASRAALAKGVQDLANMYASVDNTLSDAFAKANDAVRNQIAAFFSGPETSNPQLTFSVSNSQIANDVQFKRVQASGELNSWQQQLAAVANASSVSSSLDMVLASASGHLKIIQDLLTSASLALIQETGLSQATVDAYKTDISTALTEVTTATGNVNTATQNVASQKIFVTQLQAQLDLKLAGATAEDIQKQQALVEQAQASVQSIQVKIAKASLVSPISGVVTVQDAKVGQIATPGVVLVSIISDSGLEVDADISEADIGKVKIGNSTTMTLDAFPGQTFSGKVSYVDPGQTVIEGVPTYKTTFAFDDLGPQVKPGMTANIDIITDKHDNVIYVPQRAVITKNGNRVVMVFHGANQALEERTVTVGLRDVNGNIEVVSGLAEGEMVVGSPSQ
jgi:HlyD family secretion protein